MKKIIAVAVAVLALLIGVAGPTAAAAWHTVAQNTVSGSDPYVSKSKGGIKNPNKIRFVVTAKHPRVLTLDWYVDCTRGSAFDSKSATVNARPRIEKVVTLPVRNPNRCYADASVYQKNSFKWNRITLKIQKR